MTQLFYDEQKEYEESFRNLWRTCFQDPRSYEDFYFQSMYSRNRVLGAVCDEKVVGMIHLNPYCIQVMGHKQRLHYIVGVATEAKYRRQGVMRAMLGKAMQDMADDGEIFTYLMPADVEYYKPFDFVTACGFEETPMFGISGESRLEPLLYKDYVKGIRFANTYCEERYKFSTVIDENYLFFLKWEAMCENGRILCLKKNDEIAGLAVYGQDETGVYIRQIYGDRDEMTEELRKYFGEKQLYLTFQNNKKFDKQIMIRVLRLDQLVSLVPIPKRLNITIEIKDEYVSYNNGIFHLYGDGKRGYLEPVERPEDGCETFRIHELTQIMLGKLGANPVMMGEIV